VQNPVEKTEWCVESGHICWRRPVPIETRRKAPKNIGGRNADSIEK